MPALHKVAKSTTAQRDLVVVLFCVAVVPVKEVKDASNAS